MELLGINFKVRTPQRSQAIAPRPRRVPFFALDSVSARLYRLMPPASEWAERGAK
jgi:hypothetical protein